MNALAHIPSTRDKIRTELLSRLNYLRILQPFSPGFLRE